MNKYYLAASVFAASFLVYVWLVYLPSMPSDSELYQTKRIVTIVTSVAMLAFAAITLFLAKTSEE
ncbi:MAG: hypothetical protein JTT11_01515 [Candidatus Brockarchaeota archaeon]|nr:hypothetical protein [Candidatus Brockarchaeota archaeon]